MMQDLLEFVRWYILARLSNCSLRVAMSQDGSPPLDPAGCTAWFMLSDLAYDVLMDDTSQPD